MAAVAALPAREQEVVTATSASAARRALTQVAAALHVSERRSTTLEHDALGALRHKLPGQAVTPRVPDPHYYVPRSMLYVCEAVRTIRRS